MSQVSKPIDFHHVEGLASTGEPPKRCGIGSSLPLEESGSGSRTRPARLITVQPPSPDVEWPNDYGNPPRRLNGRTWRRLAVKLRWSVVALEDSASLKAGWMGGVMISFAHTASALSSDMAQLWSTSLKIDRGRLAASATDTRSTLSATVSKTASQSASTFSRRARSRSSI